MNELTNLVQSTLPDRYVLGQLSTDELLGFRTLMSAYPAFRHEVMLAELFLTENAGPLPTPEILRRRRLEFGDRWEDLQQFPDTVEKDNRNADDNVHILLQPVSPLYITEHKYLRLAFWVLAGLLVLLFFVTTCFYVYLNIIRIGN